MKITYENEEELEEEGDDIAYQNNERLNLNEGDDSSSEENVHGGAAASLNQYAYTPPKKKKLGKGLPKYSSESAKFDMKDVDNHYRFLQHIEMIQSPEKSQVKVHLEGVDILFPMKPYQVQLDYMRKVI